MIREDYNIDFNNVLNHKLDGLIRDLHNSYEKLCDYVNTIDKYKDYYNDFNIDISSIYNPYTLRRIEIDIEIIHKIDKLKYSFIKTYNYIIFDKIKNIQKQINIISSIRNIPYDLFIHLQDEYNIEVINTLLKGNKYSLGNNLGTVCIKNVPRDFTKRLAVNWNETKKVKKALLENNIKLYSINNTSGEKYMVYHTDDDYSFFNWRKTACKIVNKEYYKFTITKNANILFKDLKDKTEIGILSNRALGGFDKLIFLQKVNPKIKEKYRSYDRK